jgi:predicted dithiol-disulfide oxidoreductase (DUF899 family)
MSLPPVVSRDEWLVARKELLVAEKAATRARDALNAQRRRLPMVAIEKDYVFEGPHSEASLFDLFEGRRQLIVDHFMFDPSWDEGCPSCSPGRPVRQPRPPARARHHHGGRLARPAGQDRAVQGEQGLDVPTYGRRTEQVGGTHYYLDMTALGRQEDWEEPRGRSTGAPRADQAGAGRT